MSLDLHQFAAQLERFRTLVAYNSGGRPFVSFQEGLPAAWESYKPRVRDQALRALDLPSWSEARIGSGKILEACIEAIELHENNLVFWQNRYGHATRAHRSLLEARTDTRLRTDIERQLFGLLRVDLDEGAAFESLADLTYRRYPLLAYIFFIKDMDRFMPILPSIFDRAFRHLNIDLVTQRNCSWDNYYRFNGALGDVRDALAQVGGIKNARLIDAHSFCWMLEQLEEPEAGANGKAGGRGLEAGYIFGPREKSIWEMMDSVVQTVKKSGQVEYREVKRKELRMTELQLEVHIKELLVLQDYRCALTGLPLQWRGAHEDVSLLPSLDRIDSSGHYEKGNLQVVCRFINFWKQDTDNEEFRRLLMLVRGLDE